MKDRRKFLHQLALIGISIPLTGALPQTSPVKRMDSNIDWNEIRGHFLASKHPLVNLNNGSSGIMPTPVLNKYSEYLREINSFAPYSVNNGWAEASKNNLLRLSELINAKDGSLSFVRNTTEAMNLILWGINWKEGDEILKANWDYPLVDYSCEWLKQDYGINISSIPDRIQDLSDDEIVELYRQKITDKTRLIIVTWITHREGMTLPVAKICNMAHEHGIKVLLDGAHTIGQIDIDLEESGADYFACSLHKWLNAPLGSGILYIKNSLAEELRPHISFDPKLMDDLRKFEYLGTRPFHNLRCLGDALDYLELTGIKKKEERLRSLTAYWMQALNELKAVKMYTDPERSCAVASLGINKLSGSKMQKYLKEDFGIHVKTSGYPGSPMIRISPNIYTNFEDLDKFIEAVISLSKKA